MKTRRIIWRVVVSVALGSLWGLVTTPAQAFDTGHHADITRSALQDEAFGGKAVEVAQLQNWLVDYYTSQPLAGLGGRLEKLHFDNLYSTAQVRNYWGHLAINTRVAIRAAATENDPLKALTIVGASLHAVQDFYTHSNWVELHPRGNGGYRTETFFTDPPDENTDLYSGYYPNSPKPSQGREPHGGYHTGLNHDAYGRPNWDDAYVFAYVASRQWAAAMRGWSNEINVSFWPRVQSYLAINVGQQQQHLKRDLEAAYRISEWVTLEGADGHWKGRGSGSPGEFNAFIAAWTTKSDSDFVEQFKTKFNHVALTLGLLDNKALREGGLIGPPLGPIPIIATGEFKKRAIMLRTLKVEESPVGFFETKIDSQGRADFFAKISIDNQHFVEAMQIDRASISPNWTSMRFVSSTNPVPITYELWDEDSGTSGADDPVDINPAKGRKALTFQFNPATRASTGDVSGVYDSTPKAFKSEGASPDTDRARIQFFITSRSLVASPVAPSPQPLPGTLQPPPGARPILQSGAKGDWVRYLQSKLNAAGAKPPIKIDGDFGAGTKTAVKAFQKSRGMKEDGDVGPLTWTALEQAAR